MERNQQARLDTLAGIPSFLDDYVIEFANASKSPARAELDALIKTLGLQGRAQAEAAGGLRLCALRRQSLRHVLFTRHLRPIVAIARAELADPPASSVFQCPHINASDAVLLERAEAIGEEAVKFRHVFLCHGLPRDFVKQLHAAVDAIDRLAEEAEACMHRQKVATAALASGFRRAVSLVSVLNALVQSRVSGNSELRRAWDAVRRGEAPDARRNLEVSHVA